MQKTIGLALLMGAVSVCLPAATINGQFTLDGTVIVTDTGLIEWISNGNVANEATISANNNLTGSFAGLGNTTVDIHTLNQAVQPVNTPFTNFDFIDFVGTTLPSLEANFIPQGSGGTACLGTTPAGGQTCTLSGSTTPPEPAGSPFTFLNTTTVSNQQTVCCTSSATWNIGGVTSDGTAIWNGQFTATFVTPYQTVIQNFITNHQVSDAYSGVMVVTVSQIQSVPEPTTLAFMGTGLLLLCVGSLRRRQKKA